MRCIAHPLGPQACSQSFAKSALGAHQIGVKCWQYAFERFGGQQFRASFLYPEAKEGREGQLLRQVAGGITLH